MFFNRNLQFDDIDFNSFNGNLNRDSSFILSFLPSNFRVSDNVKIELFIDVSNVVGDFVFDVFLGVKSSLNVVLFSECVSTISSIKYKVVHSSFSSSNFVFKSILDGKSSLSFCGAINVPFGVESVFSSLKHDTFLLSDDSFVVSMPALEIYSNEVDVVHSASVGSFDDDKMFYLQSRGVSFEVAKKLLMDAFLLDDLSVFSLKFINRILYES